MWRYFKSSNSKWNTEGIDDTQLTEEEWKGKDDQENEWIRQHKILALHNIVACLLKEENYEDSLPAANEVLRLDPDNRLGLIRRAKSISMPVNASVEDYEQAITDLLSINSQEERILKEIKHLREQVKVNRNRERSTYGKMFFSTPKAKKGSETSKDASSTTADTNEDCSAEKKVAAAQPVESVSEYMEKMYPKPIHIAKTVLDKEIEKEMVDLDRQVDFLVQKKLKDFSFHVKEESEYEHYPQVDELNDIIKKTIDDYKIANKMGRQEDILTYQATIKQLKFAKEHMVRVLNMDFTKPTDKLKKMAKESKIDLKDPNVLEEFKVIQIQTLNDIKRMKDGAKPQTEEESKEERGALMKDRREKMYNEAVQKQKDENELADKQTEKLVKQLAASKKQPVEAANAGQKKVGGQTDKILLAVILLIWASIMIYTNYFIEPEVENVVDEFSGRSPMGASEI